MKKLLILLLAFQCTFILLSAQSTKEDIFRNAAEQIFEQSPVLCKVATYRSTVTHNIVDNVHFPDGTALVGTKIHVEAVVVEAYKGECQPGDFIVFDTGGVERGKIPEQQTQITENKNILFIRSAGVNRLADKSSELIEPIVLPAHPRELLSALENLLKERKLSRQ